MQGNWREKRTSSWQLTNTSDARSRAVIRGLHSYVKNTYDGTEPIAPLSLQQLRQLATLSHLSEAEYQNVITWLAKTGVVISVGIPYQNGLDAFAGPYLPTPSTVLNSLGPDLQTIEKREAEVTGDVGEGTAYPKDSYISGAIKTYAGYQRALVVSQQRINKERSKRQAQARRT